MARPKLQIDPKTVESLAAINCTVDEIASVIGCNKSTLERRYADHIKKGKENGKSSLRRMMWEKCKQGNVTMMIWLSKQILGYTDKTEQIVEGSISTTIDWGDEDAASNQNEEKNSPPNQNK